MQKDCPKQNQAPSLLKPSCNYLLQFFFFNEIAQLSQQLITLKPGLFFKGFLIKFKLKRMHKLEGEERRPKGDNSGHNNQNLISKTLVSMPL